MMERVEYKVGDRVVRNPCETTERFAGDGELGSVRSAGTSKITVVWDGGNWANYYKATPLVSLMPSPTTPNPDAMRAMASLCEGAAVEIELLLMAEQEVQREECRRLFHARQPKHRAMVSLLWSRQVSAKLQALDESRANVVRCDNGEGEDWGPWR